MMVVSREFFDVVKKAKKMNRITDGIFDITSPSAGMDNVILRLDNSILLRNGVSIDISGISDGAIADDVRDFLKTRKMQNVIVNVGGNIYCGSRKDGDPWLVGLKETGSDEMSVVLALGDAAVATGGEYESVPIDEYPATAAGDRPDPSGEWVREDVSGIAVIADSCAEAEALAKAMSGMEKDKAIELADSLEGVEVIVIECVEWETKLSFSKDAEKFIAKR
jgi:thiamine biosynthesis lipoprotein